MEHDEARLWSLISTGELDAAAGHAARLLAGTVDPYQVSRIESALGLMMQRVGRLAESRDYYEKAAGRRGLPSSDRASYLADGSMSRLLCGDVDGAERQAEEAARAGESTGNWFAVCEATNTLALVRQSRGTPKYAATTAQRAVGLRAVQKQATGGGPMPHLYLGMALVDCDRLAEADRAFTVGLELCRTEDGLAQVPWYLAFRSLCRLLSGDWDQGRTDALETIDSSERSGTLVTRPIAWGVAALIEAARADTSGARGLVGAAGSNRLGAFGVFGEETLLMARAATAVSSEDRYNALLEAWHHARSMPWFISWRAVAPGLVAAAVRTGDRAVAELVTAQTAEGAALAGDIPSATGTALRCEGLLRSDPEALDAAVELFRSSPRPFALAEACVEAGHLWAARGEAAKVAALVGEATEIFHSLRATAWLARGVRLLSATSSPVSRLADANRTRPDRWEALTPSERDVARLAARGLTNPQIAGELVLSARTVQTHLTHIYSKLEISSRVELAARLADRALD